MLLAALALGVLAQDPAPTLAITQVDVLTMDGGTVLRDQTVVIEGDRITGIAPSAVALIPEPATVIDGRGKWLLPGLVDSHVHVWSITDLEVFVAHGVTTVRNMFGAPIQKGWRDRSSANEGDWVAPSIVTAGPIVDGQPPVWPGSRVVMDAEGARAAVQEHVDAGYDFLKVYNRLPREAYDALVEAAAEAGMPVMGHVPHGVGIERVWEAGQVTIEHLFGFEDAILAEDSALRGQDGFADRLLAFAEAEPARVAEAARRTREAGTFICPTLVVFEQWLVGEELEAAWKRPEMRWVPPQIQGMWRGMLQGFASAAAAQKKSHAGRLALVKRLHDAGVPILLGTDQGNPFVIPGIAVHQEAALLLEAGLTPTEILRAATVVPARCFGQAEEFGRVKLGLRADLLLVDADPREDLSVLRRPETVILRGRAFPAEDLAGRLDRIAETYAPSDD